jgi:subtilase family serine protease
MTNKLSQMVAGWALLLVITASATAAERQLLQGYVPAAVAKLDLKPVGRLPGTRILNLAIGLPLRNKEALTNLLQRLYDPASTAFHQYLTPEQFTARFGPTEADYEAVLQFARSNGLAVAGTYSHRELVDVSATVSDIEKAFHITLRTYRHPTEEREFYAPDVEPSIEAGVPILSISGLNDYCLPHPGAHRRSGMGPADTSNGSGPSGSLRGKDFRNAYAHGVTLNGSGQYVGLVEFDGYYASDITKYENQCGLPNVPISNVMLSGSSGYPDNNTNYVMEASLDIEMVIAMAPGLSRLYVFEGNNFETVLSSMVTYSEIKQFSASWVGFGFNASDDSFFQQMAAQGQTFFQASGDGCAYTQPITGPCDSAYVTSVGGTTLTMGSTGTNYGSEQVWNSGFQTPGWNLNGNYTNGTTHGGYWGSGGGVSGSYPIPDWQQGLNLTAVGGSATMRNIPDVALTANEIWVTYFNGLSGVDIEGTSVAAPLWAGFTALVNQQTAAEGRPTVGFLNPALYAIGKSALYSSCFNDITNGDDTWPESPSKYHAAKGYDLCTGWGTPAGATMINALAGLAGPVFVDFNFFSFIEIGTYDLPFSTLAEGINAVSTGGTIFIKTAGSSSEKMTISKPMTITASDGAATIGH